MTLEARLAAVERTLTDSDDPPADLSDAATVEKRLATVEERLADAEGELSAVRGHVDGAGTDAEVEQVATPNPTATRVEIYGAERFHVRFTFPDGTATRRSFDRTAGGRAGDLEPVLAAFDTSLRGRPPAVTGRAIAFGRPGSRP